MILNGKKIADEILLELKQKIAEASGQRAPLLAFLLIGENAASQIYVKYKIKACEKVGIKTQGFELPKEIPQMEVLRIIDQLNSDSNVDGILVQLPLSPQLNTQEIIERVDPKKDVDGFHPLNIGRLLLGYEPYFIPCTPLGILELLKRSSIPVQGKHVVIMGRSNIVGTPMAILLSRNTNPGNCTVTLCHSKTTNLASITSNADIVVTAIGGQHGQAIGVVPGAH
jgi:methylenetetrahydrofolate dehydrogenase (NADP+)/methenyltetrahydrofolate cyclohydrolase